MLPPENEVIEVYKEEHEQRNASGCIHTPCVSVQEKNIACNQLQE